LAETRRMPITEDDKLAAAVFARGLLFGFVRADDVARWADRRIAELDQPPEWLIDLSLVQVCDPMEVAGQLKRAGMGIDPELVCRAIYSLLPDISPYTFSQAEAFALRLYRITSDCLDCDQSHELLAITDGLNQNFEIHRLVKPDATDATVLHPVQQFILEHRNEELAKLLDPVKWWLDSREELTQSRRGAEK